MASLGLNELTLFIHGQFGSILIGSLKQIYEKLHVEMSNEQLPGFR